MMGRNAPDPQGPPNVALAFRPRLGAMFRLPRPPIRRRAHEDHAMYRRRIWSQPEETEADRQTTSLAAMAVILALIVIGLFLVHTLRTATAIEDCLLAGRRNCDKLVTPSSASPGPSGASIGGPNGGLSVGPNGTPNGTH